MRQLANFLLLSALALAAFCYWGLSTVSGRRQFDEMAGMIPFLAGVLGAIAAVASGILFLITWKRAG